jgi:hypothetical protein
MLLYETVAVYCENHTEHTNSIRGRIQSFSMLKKVVHIVTIGLEKVNLVHDLKPVGRPDA